MSRSAPDPERRPVQVTSDQADAELISRHIAGDREAFGELVRRHRDRLWAVALRTLGDPEEAADAVQDALLSAFRKAETFRGESAVTTWLHRIVVNACLDRARRSSARPTVPLTVEGSDARGVTFATAHAVTPDVAPGEDLRLEIAAALTHLPLEQRAALVLVDMQGFSVEEAAHILGVPAGTVKSRCSRGRARLLPWVSHLRTSSVAAARNPGRPEPVQPGNPSTAGGGETAR